MKVRLILLFIFCVVTAARAQWTEDTSQNTAVCTADGTQASPLMVADGAGGLFVSWKEDNRPGSSGTDIYLQHLNANGQPLWQANGVAVCSSTGNQTQTALLSDGAGGVILAWTDARGTSEDIYAQRVNSSGTPQWTADGVQVVGLTGSNQQLPEMVTDGSGGVIIVWRDLRTAAAGDIFAQRIDANGAVKWTTDGVAISEEYAQQYGYSLLEDGSGGAFIVWTDTRNLLGDVYAQHINATGVIQWTVGGQLLSEVARSQSASKVITDGAGGFIVAWSDTPFPGTADLYAQHYNAAGVEQWAAGGVPVNTEAGNQFLPVITTDGDGGAIIVWSDGRLGTAYDLYAQRIDDSGAIQWNATGLLITNAATDQFLGTIDSDGDGGAIVVWFDSRNGTNNQVFGQHIHHMGASQWSAGGLSLSSSSWQVYPTVLAMGTDGAVIAWEDDRNASRDIYAQRVNASGLFCTRPVVPAAMTGNASVCAGSTYTYSVDPVFGATSYQWQVPSGWTGTSTTNSITVTTTSTGGYMSVHAENACGQGDLISLYADIPVLNIPFITTGLGTLTVCAGATGTYGTTVFPGMTSFVWTLPVGWTGSSTTNTITFTAGSAGGDVTLAAVYSCGTSGVRTQAISVTPIPSTPGAISGPLSPCKFSNPDYTISPVAGATSYTWTLPAGWTGHPSAFTLMPASTNESGGNITVSASNSCGTSSVSTLAVTTSVPPPTPGAVNGPAALCQGAGDTYSVDPVAGATHYLWFFGTLGSGWTATSTTNSSLVTAGTGSNTVRVFAVNACGQSNMVQKSVDIAPPPSVPGIITGSATVCPGGTATFGIPLQSGATHTWTLPTGWTGSSTTRTIIVTAGTSGGDITVTATNACGTSAASTKTVGIGTAPSAPGAISGPGASCLASQNTFSVAAVAGATMYTWTLPSGWTGTSTTQSIFATTGSSGGSISVSAGNACGNSAAASIPHVVNNPPPVPGSITGEAAVIGGSINVYSVSASPGATSYVWTLPAGWAGSSNTTSISTTAGFNGGNISVKSANGCESAPSNKTVTIKAKASQSITFATLPDKTMGNPPLILEATSSSALTVIYSTSTPDKISLDAAQASLLKPGRATITASQPGDNAFHAATSVDRSFCINPAQPVITFNNASGALSSSAAAGNTWYLNGVLIPNQTGPTLIASASGTYKAQVVVDACISAFSTDLVLVVTGLMEPAFTHELFTVSPNPVHTTATVRWTSVGTERKQVVVTDALGRVVHVQSFSADETTIDLENFPNGIYVVRGQHGAGSGMTKIVKAR